MRGRAQSVSSHHSFFFGGSFSSFFGGLTGTTTGGSGSIKNSYTQYRELGARTRAMLVSAAAAQWGVDASTLRTANGTVIGAGGRSLGYGELADAAMKLPVPDKVTLKDPAQFRIIGKIE